MPDRVGKEINWSNEIFSYISYKERNTFTFLNLEKQFEGEIDWDYPEYGLLWTYNLNYFEFLLQKNLNGDVGYRLIDDFISQYDNLKVAHDPYPISLRLIFWIKFFLNQANAPEDKYLHSLHRQAKELQSKLEFHLLGNHLLENAYALFIVGVYLGDKTIFAQAKKLLQRELNEQILNDGAHYELSPMYHSIMMYRLMDCIQLLQKNPDRFPELIQENNQMLVFMQEKATKMCSWLSSIAYNDQEFPHFNDSTENIAPKPGDLLKYADSLGVKYKKIDFSDSGYRRFKNKISDLIVKTQATKASYIPGHAHADNLTFELRINNKPFIVDRGISTYEKNDRRQSERSTESHNTVVYNDSNSSDVWGGFRLGKRAKSKIITEQKDFLIVEHNGYPIRHKRSWKMEENIIIIEDNIKDEVGKAYLHFHPSVQFKISGDSLIFDGITIRFESNSLVLSIEDYEYCEGYNRTSPAERIVVQFKGMLNTVIKH